MSALLNDGIVLNVPKNKIVQAPIRLTFSSATQIKNIIVVEENAEVTIIEEYQSSTENAVINALTEIHAAPNSKVNIYKIQNEHTSVTHTANTVVNQQQDSSVHLFNLTKGARLSRDNITINLAERGAECYLSGLYFLEHDYQHSDHHLHVNHLAEHCTSSMLYKGILDNKSTAVFNGKVHVNQQAQHTKSYQANHNILLSKEADVNTKPELEIYANDVKCTHGATVGQLDEEPLFYLRSRGLDKDLALRILLNAFADEVISQIKIADIRQLVQQKVGGYVEL